MKLRCTHNSIRIRIRKSELITLEENGALQEQLQFPDGVIWQYSLLRKPGQEDYDAQFKNNKLAVYLPYSAADRWIKSDQVGMEKELPLQNGEVLHILVEKDFPCTTRPDEDKSDFFGDLAEEANC